VANGLVTGMEFLQMVSASQWTTAAQLGEIADGVLDDGAARAWAGWLRMRPHAGLELGDIMTFSDSKAGAGLMSLKRRVNALVTEYDPAAHLWQQMLYLEGV
jgi:hypothetical protein